MALPSKRDAHSSNVPLISACRKLLKLVVACINPWIHGTCGRVTHSSPFDGSVQIVATVFSFADRDIYGFPHLATDRGRFKAENLEKPWEEFFAKLRASDPESEQQRALQLMTLLQKGLPYDKRVLVWRVLTKSASRQEEHPGYYHKLKQEAEGGPLLPVFEQIEKDLNRTFPGHSFFESADGQHKLRCVLRCFAIHSLRNRPPHLPPVGYCQSLNYLAGVLLLLMGEEDAFFLLAQLVECVMPSSYYSTTMDDIIIDQQVLLTLLRQKFPALYAHFHRLQIPLELVATRWLLCVFVTSVPFGTALRIWDCLFFWGNHMLFLVILAAVNLNYAPLLHRTDPCDVIAVLTEFLRSLDDPDALVQACFSKDIWVPPSELAALRSSAQAARRAGRLILVSPALPPSREPASPGRNPRRNPRLTWSPSPLPLFRSASLPSQPRDSPRDPHERQSRDTEVEHVHYLHHLGTSKVGQLRRSLSSHSLSSTTGLSPEGGGQSQARVGRTKISWAVRYQLQLTSAIVEDYIR